MLWSLAAAIVGQGSTLVVSLVTARILGPAGFGELAVVSSTVGMLGSLAGIGLGVTATKYVAELKESSPTRVASILSLLDRTIVATCAIMTVAMFLLAPWLANTVLNAPALADELRIGCPLIVLAGVAAIQTASLAGYEAFRQIAKITLVRGLVSLPISIAGANILGLTGAIVALLVVASVGLALGRRALRREHNRWGVVLSSGVPTREARVLWRYSVPAFLAGVVVGPVGWVGTAILVNQQNGYTELGVFNAANQWRTSVLFIPSVVGYAAMPIMASLLGAGGSRSALRVFFASIAASVAVVLPIATLLLLVPGTIMALYGPAFAPYSTVLSLVAVTVVMISLQLPVAQLLAASGHMWLGATLNVGWAVVFVVSAFLLVPAGWGATGLAAAYLVSYSVHTVSTVLAGWYLVRRIRSPDEVESDTSLQAASDP